MGLDERFRVRLVFFGLVDSGTERGRHREESLCHNGG
jgi:hypothetical protein